RLAAGALRLLAGNRPAARGSARPAAARWCMVRRLLRGRRDLHALLSDLEGHGGTHVGRTPSATAANGSRLDPGRLRWIADFRNRHRSHSLAARGRVLDLRPIPTYPPFSPT